MAKRIGQSEAADMFVVELAAPKAARQILEKHSVSADIANHVCDIIASISFKDVAVKTETRTLEGKIVQDSDRLGAIGAIGIARVFAYGGYKNRPMYDPNKKPSMHRSQEAYFRGGGSTISHFYEKLLLLKDRMNTKIAKEFAEDRHHFMEEYLDRFFQEYSGKM